MLDTVLEIGRVLRAAPDGLKHHRYVKPAPVPDGKTNPVRFWQVAADHDGSFDFGKCEPLLDEVRQKQLFYLNYKSSDADSSKPYLFGDLYHSITKAGLEGNFRFGDPLKKSWSALNSFQRAEGLSAMNTPVVTAFRGAFREQLATIESWLRERPNVYLHFDFGGKGWHELEEVMDRLNEDLLAVFFKPGTHGYVVSSFLYKALTPGANRSPGFAEGSEHKTRTFTSRDQALDLLYGINYASRPAVRRNDVKVVVLPRGPNLTAATIERFFERTASVTPDETTEEAESRVAREIEDRSGSPVGTGSSEGASSPEQDDDEDEAFSVIVDQDPNIQAIPQFDFIFSKAGGTKADIDLVELSGLQRSRLMAVSERIRGKREEVSRVRARAWAELRWTKPPAPLGILSSFLNILADTTRAKKKYQNHLFHVLPQIYTSCYYHDPVLLPALIAKTEHGIRDGSPGFISSRFDFYFLLKIQDYPGDRLMEIQNSPSYQIGKMLGAMAKPFGGRDSPIQSFEKNYAGLLSRRITTLADVLKLSNDISQKIVMHDRMKFPAVRSAVTALPKAIASFEGRYDRNECAFGFFEAYFAPIPAKQAEDPGESSEPDGESPDGPGD